MDPSKLTGLEIMKAFAEGKIPTPSIAKTMPMTVDSVSFGEVQFIVEANEKHINPLGGVHGGFALTIIDSVTGCALHTTLDPGASYSTIDINVKMCAPIMINQKLFASGRVINKENRTAIAEGKIFDENGKLYAYGSSTLVLFKPKS